MFAEGFIGDGVAILPASDYIYAPVNGIVSVVYKTKHAIGITSNTGVEILIHIGIDTVRLDGKYFKTYVQENDFVRRGQKLLYFNRKEIIKAGYDVTVMAIITNYKNYDYYQIASPGSVASGEKIIDINS